MQPPHFEDPKAARLKKEIAACRCRLEELWKAKECTDSEVLAAGVKLDKLLNRYHRLKPPPKT